MIRINLLPPEAQIKEGIRNQVLMIVVLFFALLGGLYMINYYLDGKIEKLNEQIQSTQVEIAKYKNIAKQVEELKKKLELIRKKLEVIYRLDKDREKAFKFLDTLNSVVLEKRMWLINLEAVDKVTVITKGEGKNVEKEKVVDVNISLTGIALDYKTVADFMTTLDNIKDEDGQKLFTGITLLSSSDYQIKKDLILKRFELKFVQPQPKLPEEDKDKKKGTDKKAEAGKGDKK